MTDLDERILWRLDAIIVLLLLVLVFVAFDLGGAFLLPTLLLSSLLVAFLGGRRVAR